MYVLIKRIGYPLKPNNSCQKKVFLQKKKKKELPDGAK
jgi:hypothetical protein